MRRTLAALATCSCLLSLALAVDACSSDDAATTDDGDGGTTNDAAARDVNAPDANTTLDASADAARDGDANCPVAITKPKTGETCTGFGKGEPCDKACGLPEYGYICFNGGPPNLNGCVQARASAFGETYCCPTNECVAEPDQDTQCSGVSGKPHLYQCPPDGTDGGSVSPPNGCEPKTIGGSPFAYYCCP